MGENIINSKKRILDTKILLKMRIDLEKINIVIYGKS